jgi:tetratricopeptide (TPR) repeat protein
MRRRLVVRGGSLFWPLIAALMVTSAVAAEEPKVSPAASSTATAARGTSALAEALGKGDSAALARDYDAAISAYRDAISKSPQSVLPHLRIAEVQKLRGELKEAEAAYDAALSFVGNDATLKAKILFCLADLSERRKELDSASERWTAYETFAKGAEKAKLYPVSAAERKKRIQEWKQISADAAQVKSRIEKRMKEGDDATRKNAASGK